MAGLAAKQRRSSATLLLVGGLTCHGTLPVLVRSHLGEALSYVRDWAGDHAAPKNARRLPQRCARRGIGGRFAGDPVHHGWLKPFLNVSDGASSQGVGLLFAGERRSDQVTSEPISEQRVVLKSFWRERSQGALVCSSQGAGRAWPKVVYSVIGHAGPHDCYCCRRECTQLSATRACSGRFLVIR
jgi:hypothetical protein